MNLHFALLFAFFAIFLVGCQEIYPGSPWHPDTAPPPIALSARNDEIDVGDVPVGEVLRAPFHVYNESEEMLMVIASVGEGSGVFSLGNPTFRRVERDGFVEFEACFEPPSEGEYKGRVDVTSSAPENLGLSLRLRGTGVQD